MKGYKILLSIVVFLFAIAMVNISGGGTEVMAQDGVDEMMLLIEENRIL